MVKATEENIKIIDEMNQEFEKEIKENKREYGIEKLLSKSIDDLCIKKEENLIMKIWYLVLFNDNDELESITPYFCLPFEKELLEAIKSIYDNIDI